MKLARSLPDFGNPPLNEVVLGLQFDVPKNYQQIFAYEVWNLFRSEFPRVEERQSLPPQFETFGPGTAPGLHVNFLQGPSHDRYWFVSEDGQHLVQFQNDRLHHNWRKVDYEGEYPRYEAMEEAFRHDLRRLEEYFVSLGEKGLVATQAEITYSNHIFVDATKAEKLQDYLAFLKMPDPIPDDFNLNFRWVLEREGKPIGRLICEALTAVNNRGKFLLLRLTARGAPNPANASGTLEFLALGRQVIVNSFAQITSEGAHKAWDRKI